MLFIPGFMQRGDAWRPVAELLPTRYPSVLLDHREHSFEGRLREIAEQGRGACWWATRSVDGSRCGPRCATRAGTRVVTLGATAGIDDPGLRSTRAEADERLAAWMEAAPIADVVGVWERQPLFADQSETLIEEQRRAASTHDPKGLAMMLRTAGQGVLEPVWHELLTFQLPLLAIAGARDEGYTAAAKRMAETAPRGQAAIVEEAGHAAQLQRPDEVVTPDRGVRRRASARLANERARLPRGNRASPRCWLHLQPPAPRRRRRGLFGWYYGVTTLDVGPGDRIATSARVPRRVARSGPCGGRPLLNLDYGGIGIRYSGGSLNTGPVTAALTDTAAGALNAAFGTTALSSSTVLGKATILYRLLLLERTS